MKRIDVVWYRVIATIPSNWQCPFVRAIMMRDGKNTVSLLMERLGTIFQKTDIST